MQLKIRALLQRIPRPLEDFAVEFDELLATPAQRHSWRIFLSGLLAPRERNKTLTALADAEPLVRAQAPQVQRLQYFLSEANWDVDALAAQRLQLLQREPATAAHARGVLVVDDTGHRKDGSATDHVARQYLGSVGKIDNGIVAVTTLWTDARLYYPLHVAPYTPAGRLAAGQADPDFRTKPQMALDLIERARAADIAFRAVVADCFYGDNDALAGALDARAIPYVLAHRGGVGRGWAREDAAHSFKEALQDKPLSAWRKTLRRFSDGHQQVWWAMELQFLGFGPKCQRRALCVTSDRLQRPSNSTWYLTTNLQDTSLDEIAALYAMRNWVEQGYKQMKDELGWADFQVRSDRAIRRHWELVCCAFAFCWWSAAREHLLPLPSRPHKPTAKSALVAQPRSGKKTRTHGALHVASDAAARARLVDPLTLARSLVER